MVGTIVERIGVAARRLGGQQALSCRRGLSRSAHVFVVQSMRGGTMGPMEQIEAQPHPTTVKDLVGIMGTG